MFDDLQEQMRHDDSEVMTARDRWLRHVVVFLIAVVVFGGVYAAIRFLEY
jgi:hypothetical protein